MSRGGRGVARRLFPLALGVLCSRWTFLGSSWTRSTSLRRTSRRAGEEAASEDEEVEKATPEADWRAFRARLVQQESGVQDEEKDKWAFESPIIEQGSVLLSQPNDHFCINQQYFHKNVIFLVDHQPGFTKGVILNRPTAYSTSDLESSLKLGNFSQGLDDWNVWCGGDCQGINSRGGPIPPEYSVLHGLERLEDVSQTITKGVYAIQLEDAKALVREGKADKDDFLLLVGYCGWGEGQLQGELNNQDTWTMASVDPKQLLGQLRSEQAELRRRIAKAQEGDIFTAKDVGDGLMMWERLFKSLGPKCEEKLEAFKASGENDHSDEMLQHWINRCLIPKKYSPEATESSEDVVERALQSLGDGATEGSVLWASPTAWLLGKPFEDEKLGRFRPSQYLHKAVLLVIKNGKENDDMGFPSTALLAMLNGPGVNLDSDKHVYWAGPDGMNYVYKVREDSDFDGSFRGFTVLTSGMLQAFLQVGALEKSDASVSDILNADISDRWTIAGGKVNTLEEAKLSRSADKQKVKWFKRFEGVELEEPNE